MTSQAGTRHFGFEVARDQRQQLAVRWFWLSVLALLGAGIFSVLLVLSRTPVIGELIPYADFFHTALVIHVDLSVLVWILSFAGVLWSLVARQGNYLLNQAVFILVAIATLMISIAGFLPDSQPIISNYIPVLAHPVFLAGLGLFGVSIGAQVLTAMTMTSPVGVVISAGGVLRFGLNCAAVSVLVALLVFFWSWVELPEQGLTQQYFELLFWGGGHVLQYTFTLLMMVCWLMLVSAAGIRLLMSERVLLLIFVVGLISVLIAPVINFFFGVTHPMHKPMYTWLMSFGGSLATFPLGLAIYYGLVVHKPVEPRAQSAHAGLMSSLLLFGAGGGIGFMITGNDVTVPAHYHGCIVGVTLALMATAYDLLPRLGYPDINYRWAKIQLWTYAVGQFLHILGLVWSGGYGVERKVAGAAQGLDTFGRVAGMGLMGLGGLISAIGGFLFIVIAVTAYRRRLLAEA